MISDSGGRGLLSAGTRHAAGRQTGRPGATIGGGGGGRRHGEVEGGGGGECGEVGTVWGGKVEGNAGSRRWERGRGGDEEPGEGCREYCLNQQKPGSYQSGALCSIFEMSVSLVEETVAPGGNRRPTTSRPRAR